MDRTAFALKALHAKGLKLLRNSGSYNTEVSELKSLARSNPLRPLAILSGCPHTGADFMQAAGDLFDWGSLEGAVAAAAQKPSPVAPKLEAAQKQVPACVPSSVFQFLV